MEVLEFLNLQNVLLQPWLGQSQGSDKILLKCALFSSFCPHLFWSCFCGPVCEKVKQYPVLYDKEMKGYKEKYVGSNAWNMQFYTRLNCLNQSIKLIELQII